MPTQQTLEAAIPSMECLSHHLPLRLAQSLADRLDGICLGVYQCRCFLPRHPCRCSDFARSAVGEWVVSLKMVAGADLRLA